MTITLDDITRCPVADQCATCAGTNDLSVATAETPVGVLCLTLCRVCVDDGERLPVMSFPRAIDLSLLHCGHLGIDADEMARLMEQGGEHDDR